MSPLTVALASCLNFLNGREVKLPCSNRSSMLFQVSTKHESQETDASKTEKCEISGGESEAVKTDDKTLCQYCNEVIFLVKLLFYLTVFLSVRNVRP